MPRILRFFYFGNQCPNNGYLLARIKTIAWKESTPLLLCDITGDERTCREFEVFSPQLLIVNGKYRIQGPFSKEQVIALLEDEEIPIAAQKPVIGDEVVRGELIPIDAQSVFKTCMPCTGSEDSGLCFGKSEWIQDMLRQSGLQHLGYLHMIDGSCVGGAEFLPSRLVPYPIPDKKEGDAFLTCVFRSDERFDYRTHPLEALMKDLKGAGFGSVSMAASKDAVLPNGPADWFERKGFVDKAMLSRDPETGLETRLLQINL